MKDVTDRIIGVIDSAGTVIACTELTLIGTEREDASIEIGLQNDPLQHGGYLYHVLPSGTPRYEFAVFVEGNDNDAQTLCRMAVIALGSVRSMYDEKHDKATFIKNIILDNILPGEIYVKSNELHFGSDVPRVVFLISMGDGGVESQAYEVISNLFPDKQRDYLVNVGESDLVLVKEVKPNVETRDMMKIARNIEDTLSAELFIKSTIGIGTVAMQLKDIVTSYKEAQLAIEVGHVFDTEKSIISFENLGVGRLIYQLPTTLCEQFLAEVFRKGSINSLDHETLFTIYKFFENNLNVSETSRKLFVHRNTLVYRLEKIKKITGLDLREFDHAIVFKVALMVRKYLASRDIRV
jgi:carbohydrate diacid regulator